MTDTKGYPFQRDLVEPKRANGRGRARASQILAYAELIGATRVGIAEGKSEIRVVTVAELRAQVGLA